VRRRGLAVTWTIAAVNLTGAAVRWQALAPLALVRPSRWRGPRALVGDYVRVHLGGLRRRSSLLRAS
jgi:hypothetical protein